jgi:predicted metal-dependent hydrolase
LRRTDAERGRQRFASWYRARAMPWIQRHVALYADRIGAHPTRVSVGSLGHRWGSCGPDGALRFHWRVILLPGPIAEYLVVHELAHLRVPRHSPEFWRSVERVLPDYHARRAWLNENGARYDV